MVWIKDRTVQKYTVIGSLVGLLLLFSGVWLQFNKNHLPLHKTTFYVVIMHW